MEVAGLAAGAVSLAGLFSGCVDCFALIQAGRAHGRDLEILVTKLDVEKTRLLQWGDAVGLLSTDPKNRNALLDTDHTRPVIERVLQCIFMLLTDGEKLRSRYGMLEDKQGAESNNIPIESTMVSRSRLSAFRAAYANFRNRITLQQRNANHLAKVKWAIRDREGFSNLTRDLHDFIDNLRDLVPVAPILTRLLVKEDMDSLPDDLGMLRLVDEACRGRGDEWSDAATSRLQNTEIASEDAQRIMEWRQDIQRGDGLTRTSPADTVGSMAASPGQEMLPRAGKQSVDGDAQPETAGWFPHQNRLETKSLLSADSSLGSTLSHAHRKSMWVLHDDALERHLHENGIHLKYQSLLDDDCIKPNNITYIKRQLTKEQLGLPSFQDFKHFKQLESREIGVDARLNMTIQFLVGDRTPRDIKAVSSLTSHTFTSIEPLTDGRIPTPTPDFCYGASISQLNIHATKELSRHILPSRSMNCPIAPNFFLEVASNHRDTAELGMTACYHGVVGARGILGLQCYGESEYIFDGCAYTLSATMDDTTLKIYAIWPTAPSSPQIHDYQNRADFHEALAGVWLMTYSVQCYYEGLTALRNAIRLTEEWRRIFIQNANAKYETRVKH
ncbi:hypothetical protein EPUS_05082 [Endocarpon pusillum Z07020]|uniref:Prion-inhibition and propagation HeLo domain-containing protein n=1 Tax=Endocarpon pusillum (strain Z07020 / HMAS-L-300199) TaxID=1263415 RepID=U1HKH4_ENDPU|nr:uncharacterized protein EPUS_05082 [Endocarpon pusillum Z07020]ERF70730.1 hypothetical protein EPUS_05082 [Endocarpon pusillum Z07020]